MKAFNYLNFQTLSFKQGSSPWWLIFMKYRKATALYSILIGLVNVLLWMVLISTGQVPDLQEQFISLIFHWISEFTMAGLLILAGIALLKQTRKDVSLYYFATGFLLIAIMGATVYYIINFDTVFIIMGIIISVSALILALKNQESHDNASFFIIGLILYTEINVMGNSLQSDDIALFGYALIAFVFSVVYALSLFLKE